MIQRKDILVSLTQLLVLLVLSTVIVATAGDEAFGNGLNEVYGIVNANGYITRGTGFTVENPYAGYYFIRFNTPYVDDDAPVCVITALSIDPLVSCTGGASPTGMDVYCNEYSLVLDPKTGHNELRTFSSRELPFSFICLH